MGCSNDKEDSVGDDSNTGGTVETITVKGVSFKMVRVDGGTFTMGATSEQGSDACTGGQTPCALAKVVFPPRRPNARESFF